MVYLGMGDTLFQHVYYRSMTSPRIDHLADLPMSDGLLLLRERTLFGEAIGCVDGTIGLGPIDHKSLGHSYTYLHAPIIHRYEHETQEFIGMREFNCPRNRCADERCYFDSEREIALQDQLAADLSKEMNHHD